MQAVGCPKCGAPLQGAPSGPIYQCPYCKHTSKSQAPVAPQFVIIQQPSYVPPPQHVYVHTPTRSAGRFVLPSLAPLIPLLILGFVFRQQLMNLTGLGQWDGSGPLICDGNDAIEVSGVTAKFAQGSAVVVRGNCHVKLTNCTLQAPTAIDAAVNGSVTVISGSVTGEIHAVDNAHVDLLGNTRATGAIRKSGNARVSGK